MKFWHKISRVINLFLVWCLVFNGNVPIVKAASPSDIALDPSVVAENQEAGEVVGTFTVTDPDVGDTHTYALVEGEGDDDNALFQIDVDQLKTTAVLDYEEAGTRSVLVEVDDGQGGTYQEAFEITVLDENDTPTDIDLGNDTVAENATIGTLVGVLSTTDQDVGDTHTYTLVAGVGGDDNALFSTDGDQLKTATVLDYEEAGTRSAGGSGRWSRWDLPGSIRDHCTG